MTEGKGIPFVDLVTPHLELEEELVGVARSVLRSGAFAGGPIVEEFEREFAKFCGAQHCIAVSNGTDALRFALMAAGIQSGDGVITVSNTFVATVEAIVQVGATPHFIDIDPRTFNMSWKPFGSSSKSIAIDANEPVFRCIAHRADGSPQFCPFTFTDRWPTWIRS